MSGSNNSVPVDMTPAVVKVGKDGSCELVVRRLRRSDITRISAAARLSDDNGSQALFTELLVRRAIADAGNQGKSIVDVETHKPVPVRFHDIDMVGSVATVDVCNALSDQQMVEIAQAAQGIQSRLSEEQLGNSEGPPAGSTPSASGTAAS